MTKFKQKLTTLILPLLLVTAFFAGGLLSVNEPKANAEGATVIDPIAKYEFKDASNLGKDSMGNYDMVELSVDANGKALRGATLLEGGGVAFDDNFCVAQSAESNMFADVTAFTLCFEVMTDVNATVDSEAWEHYIGVNRMHNGSNHLSFIGRGLVDYKGQFRMFERNNVKISSASVSDETSATKIDKTNEKVKPTEFKKIVVSVQPGGKLNLYFNGQVVSLVNESATSTTFSGDIPEGFAYANDGKSYFSIGGRYGVDANNLSKGLFVDKTATGSIRNVQFYDFAMDATCVSAYNTNGYITADDVETKITDAEVVFDGDATNEELNTEMTTDQMLALVNGANAVLKLSNAETVSTPITWKAVEKVEDKYYAKGSFVTSKLGYANAYGNEISYELPVVTLTALGGEYKGASISTAGDIGLNFYVAMRDGVESATATMQMTDFDAIEVEGVYVANKSAWAFTYPVAAKDFDKQVALTVTKVDGEAVENGATAKASVKDYIDYIKADTTGAYEREKQLVTDLDTYCKAAQDYFAGNAVEKVTENVISSSNLTDKVGSIEGEDENISIIGATLILEAKTKVNVYFTANGEVACSVNGTSAIAKKVDGKDDLYVVSVEVVAKDLSVMQEFKIGDNVTVKYSAYSYIAATVDTANDGLYNLLQAIYDCGVSALEYSETVG